MKRNDDFPAMTWRARPDLTCEHASRAWLDFTGFTLKQAVDKGWTGAVHPDDLIRWLHTCVRAFDDRRPFEIEYRLRRRNGEYRWVVERAAPRYSASGAFVGYSGACVELDGGT